MYIQGIEGMQKVGKESVELMVESISEFSKMAQAIAVEVSDYSKKTFEDGSAVAEKVLNAKSFEKAVKVQSDFAKSSYEDFVANFTKISDMVISMNKDAFKPFEQAFVKAGK